MSEYQYYEFQTIDRPLAAEQQAEMRRLSSRIELSVSRAAFNYSVVEAQWGQGISNPQLGRGEQPQDYQRISFAASSSTQS